VSDPIRSCGACTACCTVLGVAELDKGTYEACTHLCDNGCGTYATRPESCRRFVCEWLRGVLEIDGTVDTDLRPDACGVVLEYRPGTAFGDVFRAWEVEPGASARGRARDLVEGLGERFLVVVMRCGPPGGEGLGGARLVGPPRLVSQASDVMWSRRSDLGVEG